MRKVNSNCDSLELSSKYEQR